MIKKGKHVSLAKGHFTLVPILLLTKKELFWRPKLGRLSPF